MFETMKLGKQRQKFDQRTLRLEKYIKAMPPPPEDRGYVDKIDGRLGPMLNNVIGDCTCAAAAHMIQQWTTYANKPFTPSDSQVMMAYQAVSGFNPNIPGTDNGAFLLDVLNYWRKTGIAGHKIKAFVSINPRNIQEIKQAIWLFGSVYVGLGLPVTAQFPITGVNGKPAWTLPPDQNSWDAQPWSWGGHCVNYAGYGIDRLGNHGFMAITWGELFDVPNNFHLRYCDEIYACFSDDWFDTQTSLAPSGFDMAALEDDLRQFS